MNRIAIVDDNEINLTLLNALVVKLGDCQPLLFRESLKGLSWCSENLPDLIVVDFMMPEMDGIRFIQRLRAVAGREEVPILMITANDDKGVRYEVLQLGATDFLTKPVDHIEFSARVRNRPRKPGRSNGRRRICARARAGISIRNASRCSYRAGTRF